MTLEAGALRSDGTGAGGGKGAIRALAESRIGEVAGGRWVLESVLGFGGTASVYAARHRNGSLAAIKVLHPELARDARSRRRFLREAYAANRVGHPGAVSVIDDGEMPDGTPFLLLEYLSGKPLTELVNDATRPPVSEVVAIGVGILDVLAAAHDAQVIHRDIKPSNVIVTHDRKVKVLDFGIAKFHDATDADPSFTRGEAALGTPAFMSPEQAAGRSAEVDARSDLWSVGATLFTVLTGQFVHPGVTSNELLIAAATAPARSIGQVRPDLPSSVVTAIDRALLLDRAKRWPNARAMKTALLGMSDEEPFSLTTTPDRQPALAAKARATRFGAVAVGVLVPVVVAATWLGTRSRLTSPRVAAASAPGASAPTPPSPVVVTPVETFLPGALARPVPSVSAKPNALREGRMRLRPRPEKKGGDPRSPAAPGPPVGPSESLLERRQ